ncbi:MAG: cupin domain-containing protein [Nanoarchaeota archaeon]
MNKNVKELIEYSKGGVVSKVILKESWKNVTLFSMFKGTNISEHTSTRKGMIYVIEGDGIFNLEGKDIKMTPGIFIFMKENAVHSLKAKENTSFLLILC